MARKVPGTETFCVSAGVNEEETLAGGQDNSFKVRDFDICCHYDLEPSL